MNHISPNHNFCKIVEATKNKKKLHKNPRANSKLLFMIFRKNLDPKELKKTSKISRT